MPVELNHTIVASRDNTLSAQFLVRILGLADPEPFGHFLSVKLNNGVTLDYDTRPHVVGQHYAFLVDDASFDAILERVQAEAVTFYADPGHTRAGEINHRHGGRGFYFADPDGHNLEVLTRPDA